MAEPARAEAAPGATHQARDRLLVVTGLTGFAISQPMLSVLGENPAVFGREQGRSDDGKLAGPHLHRCTGRALTPRESGPARSERETNDDRTGMPER